MRGAASQDNSDMHVACYSTRAGFVCGAGKMLERIGYGRRRAHVGREAPAMEHGSQPLLPLGRQNPDQGYLREGEVSSWRQASSPYRWAERPRWDSLFLGGRLFNWNYRCTTESGARLPYQETGSVTTGRPFRRKYSPASTTAPPKIVSRPGLSERTSQARSAATTGSARMVPEMMEACT
jgi:hypothetical protein